VTPTAVSDAELVSRCRTGDHEAWRQLVERFARYVYAIAAQAYRLQPADAEDVFQEVFARTYEHLDRIRDDAAIRAWIGQLARRLCVDRLRVTIREESTDAELEAPGADETLARLDEALTVHDAMLGLPEFCREVLDRFFARDESYHTIGEALQLPSGTIASRISRCLSKLRAVLEGQPEPGGGREE
jgi:RNA polymerase sigma factor (sigma-70 family)